jgi:hypothetical protein
MQRRLFLAAGSAITLSGRTLRSQPLSGPLAPWAQAATAQPDPRIAAMGWAVLAPNPHNRQPWALRLVGDNEALLFCDLDRRLPVTDPLDRQITIGLGCFLELFRLAAAERGLAARITPFPQGEPSPRLDARPVAHIALTPGATPDPLFAAAPARRSAKQPFDTTRVPDPAPLGAALLDPAGFGAAAGDVAAIRDLVWRAWVIEAETPAAHQESVDLIRLGSAEVAANPDGISLWGPQLDPMVAAGQLTRAAMLPGQPGYGLMVDQYRAMLGATNAYAWLTTPGNTRADHLAAGRDWLRLNLAATAAGLALHPVSQALQEYAEMAPARAALPGVLGATRPVQMLGRIGFATRPAAPTPRWPAESRILRG